MNNMVYLKLEDYDSMNNRIAELEEKLEKAEDGLFFLKESLSQAIDDEFDNNMKSKYRDASPYYITIRSISNLIGLDYDDMLKNWKVERAKVLKEMEEKENEKKTSE